LTFDIAVDGRIEADIPQIKLMGKERFDQRGASIKKPLRI
jgi:hypothetical protein